eukprot:GHVP01021740.1.p1 GENE.GHVP01021740.1~~GHVP01021740.1.p1  ORF type:complete len:441 (-),score=71.46 GHVP01021740.1:816-2138(-)
MENIKEGTADIHLPTSVFYNKVQEFNRDLTVSVIKAFSNDYNKPQINILDGLSASGLRAIRYAKEIPKANQIYANDLCPIAFEAIKNNIKANNEQDKIKAANEDISVLLMKNKQFFDVIDIDPYGTASPFLDSIIQSIPDGGLLCITCTDGAVLCGKNPETSLSRYGGVSLKTPFCHEIGLRLILGMISQIASRHQKAINPLLSLSIDFYFRVFITVSNSPKKAKKSITNTGLLLNCGTCLFYDTYKLCIEADRGLYESNHMSKTVTCPYCENRIRIGGPLWLGNLHNNGFVSTINTENYGTSKRLEGMLSLALEESEDPFFIHIARLCSVFKCPTIPTKMFISALLNSGYYATSTHISPYGIKTNANFEFIFNIIREYRSEIDKDPINDVSKKIFQNLTKKEVFFDIREDSIPNSKRSKLVRFQMNPDKNWGPKKKRTC